MNRVLVALILVFVSGLTEAQVKITGMFSSMKFGTEDLSGVELYVVLTEKGYYVTVQCAEGGVGIPTSVPLEVRGDNISFILPDRSASGCPAGAIFSGVVEDAQIRGVFQGTQWPGVLPRSHGCWQ